MLDILIAILIIAWLGGFAFNVAGGLVHILLVIAIITFIFRMIGGRKM